MTVNEQYLIFEKTRLEAKVNALEEVLLSYLARSSGSPIEFQRENFEVIVSEHLKLLKDDGRQ